MFQFYKSAIMTRHYDNYSKPQKVVSILQKCDYDTCSLKVRQTLFTFQFYKSAIMTFSTCSWCAWLIRSFNSTKVRLWHYLVSPIRLSVWGFNSTKVRLWLSWCRGRRAHTQFQFYKSAIMTGVNDVLNVQNEFQFYKSAIMTVQFSKR